MNVKELIERLETFPEDMIVCIWNEESEVEIQPASTVVKANGGQDIRLFNEENGTYENIQSENCIIIG